MVYQASIFQVQIGLARRACAVSINVVFGLCLLLFKSTSTTQINMSEVPGTTIARGS